MRSPLLSAILGINIVLSAARAEEGPPPAENGQVDVLRMITVDVKLIKVSRSKLRESGVDFTTFDDQQVHKGDVELAVQQMPATASVALVEALVKNRAARVVAEPRIAAISGREARLSVGSQSEQSETEAGSKEQSEIELRMRPTLLANGKVQVDLFLKYSWQEKDSDESAVANRARHFSLDTGAVSEPMESNLFSGLALDDSDNTYVLIVTPNLVESTAAAGSRQKLSK